ncbi:hypothetical protein Drorol1_Dr00020928 [Drosera rotundifolia]
MSVSALFVFGDSTVDPGNNQFVTRTISKSNFLPYGIDFPERIPTGRYCNGRLATDFIASYLGIKEFVPPYLDPSLSLDDLVTGVSFASAGSGYDRRTSSITRAAIPVPDQLQYFSQFKRRLEESIGRERAQEIIEKAVFLVSAGTNDLAFAFGLPTFRPRTYTVSTYQRRVVYLCKQFIQGLMEQGARKIAVLNAPPIGCIPIVITTNSPLISNLRVSERRPCNDTLSSIARGYNRMLHTEIKALQASFRMNHTNVAYVDIYNPFESYIKNPHNFGLEVVDRECCGSYLPFEEFLGCNPLAIVCNDRSNFWFQKKGVEPRFFWVVREGCCGDFLQIATVIFSWFSVEATTLSSSGFQPFVPVSTAISQRRHSSLSRGHSSSVLAASFVIVLISICKGLGLFLRTVLVLLLAKVGVERGLVCRIFVLVWVR